MVLVNLKQKRYNQKDMPDLPPMPTPSDFGITDGDWAQSHALFGDGARTKIAAYNRAVEAWKVVASIAAARADVSKTVDIKK